MTAFTVVNSFNAGELSPKLLSRPDIDAYSRGCRNLKNFVPTACGAAERRPGMEYIGPVDGEPGRLAPFVFNSDTTYMLHFRRDGRAEAFKCLPSGIEYFDVTGQLLNNSSASLYMDDPQGEAFRSAFPSAGRTFLPYGRYTVLGEEFFVLKSDAISSTESPVLYMFGGRNSSGECCIYATTFNPSGLSSWASSSSNRYVTDKSRTYTEGSSPAVRLMLTSLWGRQLHYEDVRCLPIISGEVLSWTYTTGSAPSGYSSSYEATASVAPDSANGEMDPLRLRFAQSADVVFVAAKDIPPHILKRETDDRFTLSEMRFSFPPCLDRDASGTTLACGATARGASATLTSSAALFSASDVGKRFVLKHSRAPVSNLSVPKQDDVVHTERIEWRRIRGDFTFATHGTWRGEIGIYREFSETQPSPETEGALVYSYLSDKDFNPSLTADEPDADAWYRVQWDFSDMDTSCSAQLANPGFEMSGIVRCTSYTDPTHVGVSVESTLYSTDPADSWSEAAFSSENGYPEAVTIFQQRLFLAGTSLFGGRIWGSATDDFADFEVRGNEDASGLDFTIYSETVPRVCWIRTTDSLVVGTTDGEWTVSGGSGGSPLTASNLRISRNSSYGSAYPCDSLDVQDRMLFVQRDRRRVRSMVYSWENDSYRSEDISVMADHVLEAGVRELHVQRFPETVAWCLLEDGGIACCAFDSMQNVAGWHRLETDGSVASMCVLPGEDGKDRVYALARRKFVGFGSSTETETCLERFFLNPWSGMLPSSFLDCAIWIATWQEASASPRVRRGGSADVPPRMCIYMSQDDPAKLMTGRCSGSFAGDFAILCEDGEIIRRDQCEVHMTYIKLPHAITGGWIGLPYESVLSPMPAELSLQDGVSMLRRKTVHRLLVDFYGTIGGETRVNGGQWTRVEHRMAEDETAGASGGLLPARSSVEVAAPMSGMVRRIHAEVRQREPFPMCVASIVQDVEVGQ